MPRKFTWLAAAALPLAAITASAQDKPLSPEEQEYFESKIRPAFIEHCHKCHSGDKDAKVKGGLQLDSKAGLLKGGSTGPAVVPGNPEKSLLIKAIRYTDPNLQMPPKDKLPDNVVADFEQWIRMGAPDPRTGKAAGILKSEADKEKAKQHWSFRPIKKPEVPKTKSHLKTWVQNEIDVFVLAKMEDKGLLPAQPADRLTLVRRAYFDLTGLPPTPEEVEAFISDESPEAWSKLIDKLLASPHYGERWGRYWLDVARYADTKGARNNRMQENVMTQAYTYRDWVIDAFNDDLRYDKFLTYQIAADKSPTAQKKDLAAMGLLTMGRAGNNIQETIDDRIDVVTRGMMSFSVYCARCHDHKFDPIPTADYYSLYGVFQSCAEPGERPVIESDNSSPEFKDYIRQKTQIEAELEGYRMSSLAKNLGDARANTERYMLLAHVMLNDEDKQLKNRADQQKFDQMYKLDFNVMGPWFNYLRGDRSSKETDPIWGPWAMYHKLKDSEFGSKGKEIAAKFVPSNDASKKYNALVARTFSTPAPDMKVVAERYAKLFNDAEKAWSSAFTLNEKKKASAKDGEKVDDLKALSDPAQEALRKTYQNSPATFTYNRIAGLNNNRIGNGEQPFADRIQALDVKHPGAPKRAMTLEDRANPVNARVMIKGSPQNLGPEVPRRFLEVLSGPDRKLFPAKSSGRLELAEAVASDKNPLTPRVLVNRMWMNHFGAPLVRTPTDFGVRAEDPTHPELLDFLAAWFIENGWSVKKLHKLIMMSNIYQQSGDDRPKCNAVDPANLLVWKMNRRRLDFEAFRDSLLSVAGKLDDTMGGVPVNIADANDRLYAFNPYRRTVYAKVDRGNLATVFRTLDFANPDITTG
ncbi:MAG: PSD1 domain-containing protein [Verrucomicrobia bacterium]|nr:PSD1 domain-containing protein [Verrucomicrobiota bacterium]